MILRSAATMLALLWICSLETVVGCIVAVVLLLLQVAYEAKQMAAWEAAQAKQNAIALKILREALPQDLVEAAKTRMSRNRIMVRS